ncbi:MAG: glycosyltransferase [Verrucomicrobiota bacterium]
MSEPAFSVIVPTYQRNDLLARCLAALAPEVQDFDGGYEVIVSDDGKDHTAEAMVNKQFPFARWTQGPQRGPASNRNHGAAQAKARWLAFTDDDCIPQAGWLSALAKASSSGRCVYEGRTTTDLPLKGPRFQAPVNENGGYLWSCNLLIERQFFDQLGGFDEGFPYPHLEDAELRMRIEAHGNTWDFVPEAEVLHPQRPATPWIKRARAEQSAVYLCRKHGLPLSAMNLTVGARLRCVKRTILGAGPWLDKLGFLCGYALESGYLLVSLPYWKSQYKKPT